MINKLSLKQKLIWTNALIALFLLFVGTISFYTLKSVTEKYEHVASMNFPNVKLLADMRGAVLRVRVAMLRLGSADFSKEDFKEIEESYLDAVDGYVKADKSYNDIPFVEGEQELYDLQNKEWKKTLEASKKLISLAAEARSENRNHFFKIINDEFRPAAAAHFKELSNLIKFQVKESEKWVDSSKSASSFGNAIILLSVAIGFFLALGMSFTLAVGLSNSLSDLAKQLGSGATEVASAANSVSNSGVELSSSATQQASALQQTVASIEEISAMVNKNADNAKKSENLSEKSKDAAEKGKSSVNEMITSIDEINNSNTEIMSQIEESNREISEIVKVISDIGNKTKVINEIVFQTKLLSFNASVEAARAGEHGKGFAVVAEEVGNLAQMSGNAAREISQMLEGSIQKVETIVNGTKSRVERLVVMGKEKVDFGISTAKRCGEVLDEIVGNVTSVNQIISEISTACQEQSQGVQEINKAMVMLDQVTQQNAIASQQSAVAAEQLTAQSSELKNIVTKLVNTVEGDRQIERFSFKDTSANDKIIPMGESNNVKPIATAKRKDTVKTYSSPKKAIGDIPVENDPRFKSM